MRFQLVTKGLKEWVFLRDMNTGKLERMPLSQYNSVNHNLQPGDIFQVVQQNGRTYFKIEAGEVEYAEGGPWTDRSQKFCKLESDS